MVHLSSSPIAWLLLRDGHSVPIAGLSPDDLKAARDATVERTGVPLKHTSGLNAIVHCLGFDGDFGDYQNDHWPKLKALLEKNGCTERIDIFDRGMYLDLAFHVSRRAFADRYYLGPSPRPTQVFLGTVDHFERYTPEELHKRNFSREPPRVPDDAPFPVVRDAVYANMSDLGPFWNFLGDQLVRPASRPFVQQLYFTMDADPSERARTLEKAKIVVALFRRAIEMSPEGWVDIVPVTDSLLLLRSADGKYDLVWRALREGPPPAQLTPDSLRDLPQFARRARFGNSLLYFDKAVWDERDTHEAELLHYRTGGKGGLHYPGPDELLRRYYESRQPEAPRIGSLATAGSLHLTPVLIDGKMLAVSELVTITEFRRFSEASGYSNRRSGENIERANADDDPTLPVCATFDDALAYCAHLERQIGAPVRLLTYTEHRRIRPNPYANLERRMSSEEIRNLKFPTAVAFDPAALNQDGGLKWVDAYPPAAKWCDPLPWTTHEGLRFIDAWDAAEWTTSRDHNAAVTINWDGDLPNTSWGAYKMLKTCFRVVVDVAPDA